jgi:hydrogenase maturation protease
VISIIGCGNSNRSDDGVGVYVVRRLMKSQAIDCKVAAKEVRLFDAGTAGMEVMFQARGSSTLIIIDANQCGAEPGAIFEAPGEFLANVPEPAFNLHGFRWDHAIYAGRKIFKEEFPQDVNVYLIEGENLGFGLELSDSVQKSAELVVAKIEARLGISSP